MNAEEELRALVRGALKQTGTKQRHVAKGIGVTEKHLSNIMTGRCHLTLAYAERILGVIGMRLVLRAVDDRPEHTARTPLERLTKDDLDELYDDIDRHVEAITKLSEVTAAHARRWGNAATACARVRLLTKMPRHQATMYGQAYISVTDILSALDGPGKKT